ncbi:MAG: nuclear transport factor 2 family protein, partial [Pseudomonadota bacterium]
YGAPTGRKLQYRIIADCHAQANQINDEWIIRDQGAIVRQMGQDPRDFARGQIEAGDTGFFTPAQDQKGPYTGIGNDNEWGQRYADILTRIIGADMAAIPAEYDRACHLEYPGGMTAHGHGAADQFWMSLRAAFPSATFTIHHQIGREDATMPPRAALRWSLDGKHDGWGAFGAPTGARVHVMGIAHAEFGALVGSHPKLRREFVLFDETAIWKQILMGTT